MSTEMKCQGRSRELEAPHVIRERRSRLVMLPRTFRGTLHTLKAGVEIRKREIAMRTTYQNILPISVERFEIHPMKQPPIELFRQALGSDRAPKHFFSSGRQTSVIRDFGSHI